MFLGVATKLPFQVMQIPTNQIIKISENFVYSGSPNVLRSINFFFNLHSGRWNQGPLDTAAT
jgi:hypothetical protein